MSGYDNYSEIFDGDGREEQTGGGLRRQLEDVLSQNKKLTERLDQMERKETATGVLKEQGFDPAVVDLIPAGADVSEWLAKNGKFLNKTGSVPMEQNHTTEPEVQVAPDPALEEERAALENLQEATETGIPSTATADQIQKLQSFDNEADLLRYIGSGGTSL